MKKQRSWAFARQIMALAVFVSFAAATPADAGSHWLKLVNAHFWNGTTQRWVDDDENPHIYADSAPAGQVFDTWSPDGPYAHRYLDGVKSTTTRFNMPNSEITITAVYKSSAVVTHYLTVTLGSGSGDYANGTAVDISANVPPAGKVFDRWTGAAASRFGDVTSATTTFSMPDEAASITATYKNNPGLPETPPAALEEASSIVSVGTVRGQARIVQVYGLKRKTWAQFALWSDTNGEIYFKSGEKFYGRVHSNDKLYFQGNPEFFARVTSGSSTYGGSTNACVFNQGFELEAATDTMARVQFSTMVADSTMVLTGRTDIAFNGTNMLITNPARGWTNQSLLIGETAVISVSGPGTNGLPEGTVNVGGQVNGRVTVVSECDIFITNHLTYADNPTNNLLSNDALGLIANRDIVVKPSCPNNLSVYAHMMATGNLTPSDTDGSFYVEGYNSGSPRGVLSVHGGIVQNVRGPVGQFSGASMIHGYDKNYTYDTRFATAPPPKYPPLLDDLVFEKWRDL